ncbi:MAG: hypothetical protein CMI54_00235 [Parcubacteria group bacterium]|nr:hypothetical protein [Parcubacteria group bacterium]|tara:strand:- start:21905 stop:22912 length:1008 start_codon:yes stop_codon:yes gene_type:complete
MNDLAVITCFLNFDKDPMRVQAFSQFKQSLDAQKATLYTVEVTQEGRHSEIKNFCGDNHLEIKVFSPLLMKENALNVLSATLPKEFKKIAWLDCSTVIKNENWLEETSKLLDEHKLVKVGEDVSWGALASDREFFEKIGLFDLDFSGMGEYISYVSATSPNFAEENSEVLSAYEKNNLEIYYRLLDYRNEAYEYFQGDAVTIDSEIQRLSSNKNDVVPHDVELKKQRLGLLRYIDLNTFIVYNGKYNAVGVKNINEFKYPKIMVNYLKTQSIEEAPQAEPGTLDPKDPSAIVAKNLAEEHIHNVFQELNNINKFKEQALNREKELIKILENHKIT